MLQISILHEGRNVKLYEIKDISKLQTLSTFDETKGTIDLAPIKQYVGEKVLISHYEKKGEIINFLEEKICVLTTLDKDKDGIWFIEYD